MELNFDFLQAIFWSITYILLIIYAIKNKTHGISLISIVLNFSWEANALLLDIINNNNNSWIHILWFSLDLIILILALKYIKSRKLIFNTLASIFTCFVLFYFIFKVNYGMFISSFIIDLDMAYEFHRYFNKVDLNIDCIYIIIAISKLLGDLFAWMFYKNYTPIVFVIGIIVLYLNVYYVIKVNSKYKETRNQRILI